MKQGQMRDIKTSGSWISDVVDYEKSAFLFSSPLFFPTTVIDFQAIHKPVLLVQSHPLLRPQQSGKQPQTASRIMQLRSATVFMASPLSLVQSHPLLRPQQSGKQPQTASRIMQLRSAMVSKASLCSFPVCFSAYQFQDEVRKT